MRFAYDCGNPSRLNRYLRDALVAEIRGHQHHEVFMGHLDESRVISYTSA
jgi:hypothetical protein